MAGWLEKYTSRWMDSLTVKYIGSQARQTNRQLDKQIDRQIRQTNKQVARSIDQQIDSQTDSQGNKQSDSSRLLLFQRIDLSSMHHSQPPSPIGSSRKLSPPLCAALPLRKVSKICRCRNLHVIVHNYLSRHIGPNKQHYFAIYPPGKQFV